MLLLSCCYSTPNFSAFAVTFRALTCGSLISWTEVFCLIPSYSVFPSHILQPPLFKMFRMLSFLIIKKLNLFMLLFVSHYCWSLIANLLYSPASWTVHAAEPVTWVWIQVKIRICCTANFFVMYQTNVVSLGDYSHCTIFYSKDLPAINCSLTELLLYFSFNLRAA